MNTRPLRIFLLGTTLAVGAVVGLSPASDAKPITVDPIDGPIVIAPPSTVPPTTAPPTTVKPPKGIDPCDLIDCENPPVLDDCVRHPRLACDPPETTTSTTSTTAPPTKKPPSERPPKKHRPSDNPDVVVSTPQFTG